MRRPPEWGFAGSPLVHGENLKGVTLNLGFPLFAD